MKSRNLQTSTRSRNLYTIYGLTTTLSSLRLGPSNIECLTANDIFIAKFKKNGTIYLNSNPASAEIMDLRSKSESQDERKFSTSAVR